MNTNTAIVMASAIVVAPVCLGIYFFRRRAIFTIKTPKLSTSFEGENQSSTEQGSATGTVPDAVTVREVKADGKLTADNRTGRGVHVEKARSKGDMTFTNGPSNPDPK